MNVLERGTAALAIGAGVYVVGLQTFELVGDSQTSAQVETCASKLGPIATEVTTIPTGCGEFKQAFGYTATTVEVYSPDTQSVQQTSQNTIYHLPAAAAFRTEQLTSIKDQNNQDTRFAELLGGFLGFTTTAITYLILTENDKRRRKAAQESSLEQVD